MSAQIHFCKIVLVPRLLYEASQKPSIGLARVLDVRFGVKLPPGKVTPSPKPGSARSEAFTAPGAIRSPGPLLSQPPLFGPPFPKKSLIELIELIEQAENASYKGGFNLALAASSPGRALESTSDGLFDSHL